MHNLKANKLEFHEHMKDIGYEGCQSGSCNAARVLQFSAGLVKLWAWDLMKGSLPRRGYYSAGVEGAQAWRC